MSPRLFAPLLLACTLASAIPVEVNHPVAGFLRRLEEKGLIHPGFWNTLPRSEAEVARALEEAHHQESSLSSWDRRRLARYREEFDPALKRAGTRLRYQDTALVLYGHVDFYTGLTVQDSIPKRLRAGFGTLSPGVEGTYGDNVYFLATASISSERNRNARFNLNYDPQRGLPYNTARVGQAPVSTFDGFRTLIGFGDDRIRFEAGQDWNQWGPGHWQHATLGTHPYFWVQDSLPPGLPGSAVGFNGTDHDVAYGLPAYAAARSGYRYPGEGAPLPQLRFKIAGKNWEYTKIVAQRMGMDKNASAYLVAHRLQLRFGSWSLGGTEMLAVGDRSLDGIAMIPGVPLKIAEHGNGDLDNSALSGDIQWTWSGKGRFYAEFYLDDYSGPPLDFWGNKFAWVVGASLQDPLGLPSEVHLEYARVDPWVYGHHLNNTQMQSYGALLGSSLPPNSHGIFASATFPLPAGFEGAAEWQFRQRDLKSAGSSIFDDYYALFPNVSSTKQFLAQDVETRNQISVSAEWTFHRTIRFKNAVGLLRVDSWKGHPGENLTTPILSSELFLKY
jgi:hypothetical protein